MRSEDPRISIVITSYNHRAYLIEAIESVLGQTHAPHEIVVADDGSNDGSQDTIRLYERQFPGLVKGVCQPRNSGIPHNRNAALRLVTGDYVGILDGDDWFLPHKLERQVSMLRAHPKAKGVYGNFRIVDARRRPMRVKWSDPQPTGDVFGEFAKGKPGVLRTLIVEYEAVKQAGFMDERFPRFDGLWLTMKLAATCRLVYVDDILLDKRDHPTSDSKTLVQAERQRELAAIYRELLPLLETRLGGTERAAIASAWHRILQRGQRSTAAGP